ncbi:MAG: hypothetical protein KIH64_003075, partial [Mycobacterium sp.]|nr:hypothetical protein [Mycobacterium sp.]
MSKRIHLLAVAATTVASAATIAASMPATSADYTPTKLAAANYELTALSAPLVAANAAGPVSTIFSFSVGNGADAPADCPGTACNGGNAGILWG